MALTRRAFLISAPAIAGALGCGALGTGRSGPAYVEIGAVRRGGAVRKTILVCMPETKQTHEVWTGLSDELGRAFDLTAVRVDDRAGAPAIAEGIARRRPAAVILMNNPTVAAYRDYQHGAKTGTFPPAVVVMSSFLDGRSPELREATGISYEVPLVTVVTNLRKLISTPIERVGVIYRTPLAHYVHRQARLAAREQTMVAAEEISAAPNPAEIWGALRRLKRRADAVWVLNDNLLLTPQLIAEAWLPGLDERPFIPAIVGAASLVSSKRSFGTFAMLPDHTALGAQAASMVFDIEDNAWRVPEGDPAQFPLSTTTTIDLQQARERFALRADALSQVDRIVDR
jgi:hypothetical protein